MTTTRNDPVPRAPTHDHGAGGPQLRRLTLAEVEPGQRFRVTGVHGEDPTASRLRELGFVPGTEIACGRRAPLGDPTIYLLRGAHICLRQAEARRIAIEHLHADQPG